LVQEALNNIVKHAAATHVEIFVSDADGELTITVRDDGVGFDVRGSSAGFGLVGMRERLALVSGTLELDSAPGTGTVVRAARPSRRREAGAEPVSARA
jgi:signal transduction histidine kinase